jgi:flagellar basal body rod protein FlgG
MNIGPYQSAAALSALERWQEVVSQNVTASQVAGFKKRTVDFSSQPMGEMNLNPNKRIDAESVPAFFPKAQFGVNFQAGDMNATSRDLDVAIQGEGFFEVQMPDGSRGYTRAGEFHLSADRTLVNSAGLPVLSDGGGPIALLPEDGRISIGQDGMITQGDTEVGRLAVVNFKDVNGLVPLAGGLFVPAAGADAPIPVESPQVMQGSIESSNVAPLREMISLVQIARAYEANQKIITSTDQTLQRALETLG